VMTETSQTDVAIAGHVYGNIYLAGQRTQSAAQLLAGYLERLRGRCGTLPLQGVREQRAADDVLKISLGQVVMQMATRAKVGREVFDGADLESFDAPRYLELHRGVQVLPQQQRTHVRRSLSMLVNTLDRAGLKRLLEPGAAPPGAQLPDEHVQLLAGVTAD